MRLVLAASIALSPCALAQTTWHVDVHGIPPGSGSSSDPYTSIQYALDRPSTVSGDTLLVAPGVYAEKLVVDKAVFVKSSAGPLQTVLHPTGNGNAVRLQTMSGSELEGFTVVRTGANSADLVSGSLTHAVRRCILMGNGSTTGVSAGIEIYVDHCLITGNDVGLSVQGVGGYLALSNSIVWGNATDLFVPGVMDVHYSAGFGDGLVGIGGIASTTGSMVGDPGVRDLARHDFHLLSASICIDAGDPASPLDPDGSRADIGPLSFDASYAPSTTYCTAKINSQGCAPSIGASGNASATAAAPFTVNCTNELNHRLGLLFYGFAPKNIAYQGGYLCVQAPVHRTPLLDSGGNSGPDDCSGVYGYDFNVRIQSGIDPLLEPGVEVFAQFWSRDPGASFTTNRSDAIRFTIAP